MWSSSENMQYLIDEERAKFVLYVQANMDQGDVIIRPSSKGEDHLTVSWKVTLDTSFLFSDKSDNRYVDFVESFVTYFFMDQFG
jgi:hypothetical protein